MTDDIGTIGGGTGALDIPEQYLAYAAVTPPPARVRRAVAKTLDSYRDLGSAAFVQLVEERERLRSNLARLIGADPENIAFVPGTTHGITALALSIPWQKGDRVVLFSGEFPANVTPWQAAAKLFDLDVRFVSLEHAVRDPGSFLEPLEALLKQGVRLVAVSAVQFQTGFRMPLPRIRAVCERYGAELSVDAIQACGIVPMDVTKLGIDYLICGAHKWMMGIDGAGFLYAADRAARALQRRTPGWLSHEDGLRFLFEGPGALRYDRPIKTSLQYLEGSSLSSVGYSALGVSVEALLTLGVERIYAHVTEYLDALERGLEERGIATMRARAPEHRSGILSFVPPAGMQANAIARELQKRGVFTSMPDGLVRFAPHYPNPAREVPTVLGALDDALATLRAG